MTIGYGRESGVTRAAGEITLRRSPADTNRPATLWTAMCPCGWSHQWGVRKIVLLSAKEHHTRCPKAWS